MRSAAQFADAANARSAAASSGANQAAYDAASNASYNKYERDYETSTAPSWLPPSGWAFCSRAARSRPT